MNHNERVLGERAFTIVFYPLLRKRLTDEMNIDKKPRVVGE